MNLTETQIRILTKATEMFKLYGIRAVTLDDIAKELGISKKTIYQCFEDKDSLVGQSFKAYTMVLEQQCNADCKQGKDAIEEIFLIMKRLDENLKDINPLILLDLKKFHHQAFEQFNGFLSKNILQTITVNINRGIEEGLYRHDIAVNTVATFRIASIWLPFDTTIFPASQFKIDAVSKEILELFLYGLVTAKGHKLIEKYKQKYIYA